MQSILCDCVPWPPDQQDQADQLLYGLAPIWPHNQVSPHQSIAPGGTGERSWWKSGSQPTAGIHGCKVRQKA